MAPQGQSRRRARYKSQLRQKSCMKTSSLPATPSKRAAKAWVFGTCHPVLRYGGGNGTAAAGAPELGAGEQFPQFRLIARGEQGQGGQHAGDRRPTGRQGVAMAGESRDFQSGIVDALDEADT